MQVVILYLNKAKRAQREGLYFKQPIKRAFNAV